MTQRCYTCKFWDRANEFKYKPCNAPIPAWLREELEYQDVDVLDDNLTPSGYGTDCVTYQPI